MFRSTRCIGLGLRRDVGIFFALSIGIALCFTIKKQTNMKKSVLFSAFFGLCLLGLSGNVSAQSYRTGAGVFVDFGDGRTYAGPHIKHFFSAQNAGQAMVLFADNRTLIGAEYSYNDQIRGADGLSWFVGIGPQAVIRRKDSYFVIRPAVGLEFKIPGAPLATSMDWRPMWALNDGSDFVPGRFGFAFKFTFR